MQAIKRIKDGREHFAAQITPTGLITGWVENIRDAAAVSPSVLQKVAGQYKDKPRVGHFEVVKIEHPARVFADADIMATAEVAKLKSDNELLRQQVARLKDELSAAKTLGEDAERRAAEANKLLADLTSPSSQNETNSPPAPDAAGGKQGK